MTAPTALAAWGLSVLVLFRPPGDAQDLQLAWALGPWLALSGLPRAARARAGGRPGDRTGALELARSLALALPVLALAVRLDAARTGGASEVLATAGWGLLLVGLLATAARVAAGSSSGRSAHAGGRSAHPGGLPAYAGARSAHAVARSAHAVGWTVLVVLLPLAAAVDALRAGADEPARWLAAACESSPLTWLVASAREPGRAVGPPLAPLLAALALLGVASLGGRGAGPDPRPGPPAPRGGGA